MLVHWLKMGPSQLLACWLAAHNMFHDGNLSLDIVNLRWLLLFFSSGNIEPFWTYQNFSSWKDVHVHSPPIYGRSIKWRNSEEKQLMKWVGILQVEIFWLGIFWGEIFLGGVWWVGIFRVGIFPGGIFQEPLHSILSYTICLIPTNLETPISIPSIWKLKFRTLSKLSRKL